MVRVVVTGSPLWPIFYIATKINTNDGVHRKLPDAHIMIAGYITQKNC